VTFRVYSAAYGGTARSSSGGVDADEDGWPEVPCGVRVVGRGEEGIDTSEVERVVVVGLHDSCVFSEVHLFVGRHDSLYEFRPFFIAFPRGYFVLHVRALHEVRATARLAHERDADRVKHRVPVIVFEVHEHRVVARLLLRRGEARPTVD